MNRLKRAIEYSKAEVIRQNPWLADKQARIDWWKTEHPIKKEMFLESMAMIAEADLNTEEELEVVE